MPPRAPDTDSIVTRLIAATEQRTGVRFVGHSVLPAEGDAFVSWAQLHDEARVVAAALQARGLVPGDHVAILGPTSRSLMTIIQGCWLAGIASMVLPLPMRMGSLDVFVETTRARIRHGDAKLILIDDMLAAFYAAGPDDPPIEPMAAVLPGFGWCAHQRSVGATGTRPRAAGHPAVHQRVDQRAERGDDPRSSLARQPRRVVHSCAAWCLVR
jgi:hypothetical protein